MVSRRDLTADPARRDAARFRRAAEAGRQLATGPHGIVDLGDGDTTWTDEDGNKHSVRDDSVLLAEATAGLAALDENLATAEESLAQAEQDITQAKTDIAAAQAAAQAAAGDASLAKANAQTAIEQAGSASAAAAAASSAATNAQTAANSAATAAATAQTKADTAASDLLALAGRTGRVIRSASKPTAAADKNSNNLWLNTATGQLHEWNGSDWVLITDTRLSAAISAADAAGNLAEAAKSQAESAAALAGQAKTQAESAASVAAGAEANATAAKSQASSAAATASSAQSAAATAQGRADSAWEKALAAATPGGVILNPSYEQDLKEYTTVSGAVVVREGGARTGSKVLTVPVGVGTAFTYSNAVPTSPGRKWLFQAWFKRESGTDTVGTVRLYASYLDSAGVAFGAVSPRVETVAGIGSEWFRLATIVEAPEGAARVRFAPRVNATNSLILVDDLFAVDVTEALAAQAVADQAVADAQAAKNAADAAAAAALGAQAAADDANNLASTADGRYTVAPANPTPANGAGKPVDAIWEVRAGSTSLRRFVWTGSVWTQIKAGQDFIGEKAIGRAQIGDLAVGTAQMADLSVTNAKVGDVDVAKLTAAVSRMDYAAIKQIIGDAGYFDLLATARLIVGNTDNLAPSMIAETAWGGSGGTFVNVTDSSTGRGLRMVPAANTAYTSPPFAVTPGEEFYMQTTVGRIGSSRQNGGRWYFGVTPYAADGTRLTWGPYAISADVESRNWGSVMSGTVTIPAEAATARIRLTLEPATSTPTTDAHTTFYDVVCLRKTGTVMLANGAVTADKILADEALFIKLATESFVAKIANIITLNAGRLTVTEQTTLNQAFVKMLAAEAVAAGRITTLEDPSTFRRTVMDSGGLRVLYRDPKTNQTLTLIDIGNGGTDRATFGSPGALASATIDGATGTVSATNGAFNELTLRGKSISQHLIQLPQGVVPGGYVARQDGTLPFRRSEVSLVRAWPWLEPNRLYRVTISGFKYTPDVANITVDQSLLWRWANGTESYKVYSHPHQTVGSWNATPSRQFIFSTGYGSQFTSVARQAIFEYNFNASDFIQVHADNVSPITLLIEDIGPSVPRILNPVTWADEKTGGSSSSGGTNRTTYTKVYSAIGAEAYWGSNGGCDTTYGGIPIQGTWDGAAANSRFGLLIFPSMTADLAGATINGIDLQVTPTYVPWNPGYVGFALHGNASAPASQAIGGLTVLGEVGGAYAGAPVNYSVPSSRFAGFINGSFKGIAVYSASTANNRYMRLAANATITVNYTK